MRVRQWVHRDRSRAYRPAAHPAVEVAWVGAGVVRYGIGHREIEVGPGAAIVVPAQTEHVTRIESGTEAISVWLSSGLVAGVAEAMATPLAPDPVLRSRGGTVEDLARLLGQEAGRDGPGQVLAIEALAEALAVTVLRAARGAASGPAVRDPRIQAAVDAIERDFAEPLTVEDLAAAASLSRFHFSRIFRDQVGVSPYRYLVSVRLDRAAELLRRGRRSVTEVALSVGFQDLGRFSRAFAARFGQRPSELLDPRRRGRVAAC